MYSSSYFKQVADNHWPLAIMRGMEVKEKCGGNVVFAK